jgi:DNA mismatch repair protein MutL
MNRNGIYIFVNRRLVRDRLILHAIHEAYRNILPPAVFPATLLFLEMPYDEVDVNVHPAKIEVRFRRSQFVHDFARDAIRQALMGARPIASFAAAAAAVPQTTGFGNGPFSGGITPAPVVSGVPPAIIPPMEEIGVGSGVGSDGGFDLTSAAMRPVEQRIPFTSGTAFGQDAAAARISTAERGRPREPPATGTDRGPKTAGTSQREFHHCRERRRTVDRRPARGARARALRAAPGSAPRRKSRSAAHAHAAGHRTVAPPDRHV